MKMTDEKKQEAYDQVVATLKQAWLAIFSTEIKIEKEVFTDDFVACVCGEDVFIEMDTSGEKIVYHPGYIHHYSGMWRYHDGSGEPPSEEPDYLIESGTPLLSIAINEIIAHNVEVVLDNLWTSIVEKEIDSHE